MSARSALTTESAVAACAAFAEEPAALPAASAGAAGATFRAVAAVGGADAAYPTVAAGTTGPAGAEQAGRPAGTPVAAGATYQVRRAVQAGTARPAIAAVAKEPPACSTGATVGARAARTASTPVADQTGGPTGTAGRPRSGLGIAVSAVAVEQPPGSAVGVGCGSVGAITDERAPQQGLGGCVDHTEQGLFDVGRLGLQIRLGAGLQRLQELVVKLQGLRTDALIALRMGREHGGHRGGNFVRAGRRQCCCRQRCGRVGGA
ncbi:hypothetical protein MYIN104542_29770 [Mycobacterium intermedium]